MANKIFDRYLYPGSVFAAGMMGVGFLSLPYIASQAGIWLTLFYFAAATAIAVIIHLIFVEISLNTPDFKRFPGFVSHYLGKKTGAVASIGFLVVQFGVLLAYLLVGGEFLFSALTPLLGGTPAFYTLAYFVLGAGIVFFGIKIISRLQFFILSALLLALLVIFFEGFSHIQISNLLIQPPLHIKNTALPYGPLLFSLWGVGLIPIVEEMLRRKKNGLKRVVLGSTLVVSVIYLLFTIFILGIAGDEVNPIALTGLDMFLEDGLVTLALLVGAAAVLNAFVAQGNMLCEMVAYDLKVKPWQAFVIATFTPMVLFLLGITSFIPLISFIGGVLLGIFGIMILLMYHKIGGRLAVVLPLSLVFILGILYEVAYFIA